MAISWEDFFGGVKMYYIYCYTNRLNNKKYIGKTNNIERRKREHLSTAFNKNSKDYNLLFHQKIREYGIENFSFEILDKSEEKDEINYLEIFWIEKVNSFIKNNQGYNLTIGGDGNSYSKFSKEEIYKIKDMITSGVNYDLICKEFKISKTFISNINYGKFFYDENEKYPLFQYLYDEEIYVNLYNLLKNTKLSYTEISKKLNLCDSTIKKYNLGQLKKNNLYQYPIRKLSSAQMKANIVKDFLINSNFSLLEIEKKCQVSQRTIVRINNGETHKDETLDYPLRK